MRALLLGADYYGTLAAARCYGKSGFSIAMADASRRARGLYSRHVGERLEHPPLSEPDRLVDWLVAYGRAHPGTLLYPPNDHLAWLFARHRERLGEVFFMYSPDEHALVSLLDKKRLHDACADVGIAVPKTRVGDARGLACPLLVKPRTQAFLEGGTKGIVVRDARDLASALTRFRSLVRYAPVLTARHPDIVEPLVQEYLPAAETRIYSVSGFVTETGEIVCRAAMKVLQRPRKVGIGLCFEDRPMESGVERALAALARRVGYHGCFEAELIAEGERRLLIDYNPRFYSQMGFDIARGLRLPLLVWHAARGDGAALADELARARASRPDEPSAYCHKAMLELVLALQGLSGKMSRADVERWRAWHARHRTTDAVDDPDDRLPAVVDAAHWAAHFARHPRSFVRDFVLDRN